MIPNRQVNIMMRLRSGSILLQEIYKHEDIIRKRKSADQILVNQDEFRKAELKKKGLPWEKAKAWDHSAILGNWITGTPEIWNNPIHFSLNKNGTTVQSGSTEQMIFSFNDIVAHISKYFSLNIGDLIYTGTPAGVGECVSGDLLEGFYEKERLFALEIK